MYSKYDDRNTTGILFDRAPVIEIARKHFDQELIRQERIEFHAGDFFEENTIPDLHDGDCVLLRYILHDWNDEDSFKILKNIRSKIGDKKVTILIGESAMPNRDTIGNPAAIHNIDMHMMVMFGASERYPKYWKKLLEETGFEFVDVHPTRSLLAWVEATPNHKTDY